MNKKSTLFIIALSVVITLGISISVQSLIAAWVSPTLPAPGNNVDAPINVGSASQTKAGGLTINGVTNTAGGFVLDSSASTPDGVVTGQMWLQ